MVLSDSLPHKWEGRKKLGRQNSLEHYLGIGYDSGDRSPEETHRWPDGPPDPYLTGSSP